MVREVCKKKKGTLAFFQAAGKMADIQTERAYQK